ncbi:MAG TPA: glycosyltransferase family 4 protein [Solirubrobacteraceae bacterium]|jgi:glycosyltransferase involved in cell wall biosynthesis
MHLVWISDSPTTPSGFGNVTAAVCGGLARKGHRVSILGWQTKVSEDWNGCRLQAAGKDPWGSDALFAYLVRHRPDAVVALADAWWLPYFAAPHMRRQMELLEAPWALYFPVDGELEDGLLPASWIELLREVDVPVAMSRYGQEIADRCGIDAEYIPHGVDTRVFAPPADKHEAKAALGLEGRFVVLCDSRNQPRKLLPRLLEVFASFARGRPDAVLHLHTDPDDEFARSAYYSYDVRADVEQLGLADRVSFTPGFAVKPERGLTVERLARYYQAADVHLLASSGEGFGLPTLQAASSGVVPFASDYSASRELVAGHGEAIEVADWTYTEFGIKRALIDVEDAAEKLARYYDDPDRLAARSHASRRFALAYDWEGVIDEWDKLLCSLRSRVSADTGARSDGEVERVLPSIPGVVVKTKVVSRQLGRLEASISADLRKKTGDIRIPATSPPSDLTGVEIPRQPGLIGVGVADYEVFAALRRVFPALAGWYSPEESSASESESSRPPLPPGVYPWGSSHGDLAVAEASGEQLRDTDCAQSLDFLAGLPRVVLIIDQAGALPEPLRVKAALAGVPCIGPAHAPLQAQLWPRASVKGPEQAYLQARGLLSDAARLRAIAVHGSACAQELWPDVLAHMRSALHASYQPDQARRLVSAGVG